MLYILYIYKEKQNVVFYKSAFFVLLILLVLLVLQGYLESLNIYSIYIYIYIYIEHSQYMTYYLLIYIQAACAKRLNVER